LRHILTAAVIAALPQAALAQFGGLPFPTVPSSSSASSSGTTDSGCKSPKKKRGAAIFGSIAGNLAGRAAGSGAFARFVPVAQFTSTITEAIACRLDAEEQKKAAEATDAALESGKVGQSATWTSDTRQNVSGTSTITAVVPDEGAATPDTASRGTSVSPGGGSASPGKPGGRGQGRGNTRVASAGGPRCMMVTDVIIVDGEESRAEKKMCKGPGQTRYVLSA
jgi:surface antigen